MPRQTDDNASANNSRRKRRRRRFGKWTNRRSDGNNAGVRSGFFVNGVSVGMRSITWIWQSTTSTLSGSNTHIGRGGGGAGGEQSAAAGIGMVVGAVAIAGAILFRARQKRRGIRLPRPQPLAGGGRENDKKGEHEQQSVIERRSMGAMDDMDDRSTGEPSPTKVGDSPHVQWSPGSSRHRQINTTGPTAASDGRRLSLYDVLTGEAPLPLPRDEKPGATVFASTAGSACGGLGYGFRHGGVDRITPLAGGARRASIFDRIADVVFNEEEKDQNPVDAVAVRNNLEQEFRVSFREGAMGMTLSMDPDSRDAFVGKIVEQGQAFRAGIQTGDLVIGVGEHNVSSYGTVLAFMNIMGRPIELHFRKAGQPAEKGGGSSGGEPISNSFKAGGSGGTPILGSKGAAAGGGAAMPEGMTSTSKLESGLMAGRGSLDRAREGSSSAKLKGLGTKFGAGKAPISPISPRSSTRISELGGLGREVASSDSSFSEKMERGVVVTKYGKKGAAAQRVLFLDGASMSVAWRELDARSPGHRRSPSLTNIVKGKREALALAHLIEVVAGDDPDPTRPSEKGSPGLREHCDESLLERSFALQFKERSLEMTCDSHAEMRQLVTGFRDLQSKYGQ